VPSPRPLRPLRPPPTSSTGWTALRRRGSRYHHVGGLSRPEGRAGREPGYGGWPTAFGLRRSHRPQGTVDERHPRGTGFLRRQRPDGTAVTGTAVTGNSRHRSRRTEAGGTEAGGTEAGGTDAGAPASRPWSEHLRRRHWYPGPGKAAPGDRTLVDGSTPYAPACGSPSPLGTLDGRSAFAAPRLPPPPTDRGHGTQGGPASWVPQRAIGHPDAGCAMLAICKRQQPKSPPGGQHQRRLSLLITRSGGLCPRSARASWPDGRPSWDAARTRRTPFMPLLPTR